MTTDKKLYAAIALLAVLGGALFLQTKKEKAEAEAHSLGGQAAALPKIEIKDEQTKAIDKIVLTKPADGDGGAGHEIELTKQGEDWKVTRPVEAAANQTNVKSLLDNLKTLKVVEAIDTTSSSYEKFGVSDGKGLHAVFSKGGAPVLDVWQALPPMACAPRRWQVRTSSSVYARMNGRVIVSCDRSGDSSAGSLRNRLMTLNR